METVETAKPAPSKFWYYVGFGTLGLIIRFIGKGLKANGWGESPDYIATAMMYGLFFSVSSGKLQEGAQEGVSEFVRGTLWITSLYVLVFALAPFLTKYFHVVIAYGISVLPVALSLIIHRSWQRRSQPFSTKTFFNELGIGLSGCLLFGLGSWLLQVIFP